MGPEIGRAAGGPALLRLALSGALLAAAAEAYMSELMSAYTVVHFKRRHHQAPVDRRDSVSARVDEMVRDMCKTRPDHPKCAALAREAPSATTAAAAETTSPAPVVTSAAAATTPAATVAATATTPAATPTTAKAVLPFDCEAGRANWKDWWPHEKKVWCCAHAKTGCYDAVPPPCDVARAGPEATWHRDGETATSDWLRERGRPESQEEGRDAAGCTTQAGGRSSGAPRRGPAATLGGLALLALALGAGRPG